MKTSERVLGALSAAALIALAGPLTAAQAPLPPAPLYKDASQSVDARVEDLLKRMTLDEKVAQLETVWEHKDKIQTPDGTFAPDKASQNFPSGIGQIARPSDRRGVTQGSVAAGAARHQTAGRAGHRRHDAG